MTLSVKCVLCTHDPRPLSLLQSSMPAVMTMLADHAAQQLLDFNQKLDINLLDNVVNCLYHGVGPQVCYPFLSLSLPLSISTPYLKEAACKFLLLSSTLHSPESNTLTFCKTDNVDFTVAFSLQFFSYHLSVNSKVLSSSIYSKEWHKKC